MKEIKSVIQQLPYWEHLTPSEKERVAAQSTLREYEKGQPVGGGCSDCLGMVLVLKGSIRAYMLSEEGREITLFRLYEKDPCVLSASCVISQITFETQIVAEQNTRLLVVGSSLFKVLTEQNIYVRCFMFELMTQRFSSVMWSMQEILFKGYDRRLAGFLIKEYDRTGNPEFRMTHEQLAQQTSSAREVTARMLKRFAADGLVELSRGSIRLKDIRSLSSFN